MIWFIQHTFLRFVRKINRHMWIIWTNDIWYNNLKNLMRTWLVRNSVSQWFWLSFNSRVWYDPIPLFEIMEEDKWSSEAFNVMRSESWSKLLLVVKWEVVSKKRLCNSTTFKAPSTIYNTQAWNEWNVKQNNRQPKLCSMNCYLYNLESTLDWYIVVM